MRKKSVILFSTLIIFLSGIGLVLENSLRAQDSASPPLPLLKKFQTVLTLIKFYYVEDVDWGEVIEGAIAGMLEKLDPHSVYLTSKDLQESEENFSGHFEGIGIQYDIVDGAVLVVSPISGSPAEKVGLMAGDRIIEIDGESTLNLKREDVPKKLKGPKGTVVRVKVLRDGFEEPFDVEIVRDVIPINTVSTAFMLDENTGYIFVNRFAATTNTEVEEYLRKFEKAGMKRLILDLRGNPGGYLSEAVKLAGKFLPDGKLIVYTKSRDEVIGEKYLSDMRGSSTYRNYPLIILVDRGSASASEIVAGAIQDHDRGLILGTRTFGKGLVQRQFPLDDGSAVRITISKYYTPSGRCIQRPYKGLNSEQYYLENVKDTAMVRIDSSDVYYTAQGRKVYGGGGIIPDKIVPYRSFSKSPKLNQILAGKRLYFDFASHYIHQNKLSFPSVYQFYRNFEVSQLIMNEFADYLKKKEISFEMNDFQKDFDYIAKMLKAEMARVLFGSDAYYEILMRYDNQVMEAMNSFKDAEAFAQRFK